MILKLLNGSFTPNIKSIDGALYVQWRQQLSLQQKNNANILSETAGLFKSEVGYAHRHGKHLKPRI